MIQLSIRNSITETKTNEKRKKKELLSIDSLKGGNGDIWMRLVGFYVVAKMLPQYQFQILVPSFFTKLATYTFGDRLNIAESSLEKGILHYTSKGIKDLIKPILKGRRFISPYQRSVIYDKGRRSKKDKINIQVFNIADFLGVIQVPDWKWIPVYQGYSDIIGIKKLRCVTYEDYVMQLKLDYDIIFSKLQSGFPLSPGLIIPSNLKENIVVFPTGTSRQFVPLWWAIQYLTHAYYAFFYKDTDAKLFAEAGLKVVYFYHEPGDIIQLAKCAAWAISTDSFPSHLLQYATKQCTITITELSASRIISPAYKGNVVHAVAPCHPCIHLDRKNHPLCAAGFAECINWESEIYSNNIVNSVHTIS